MKIDVFNLNSIKEAKTSLAKCKNELESQLNLTIQQLTQAGYEYMMSIVKVESSELASSITWNYDAAQRRGIIEVGAEYAIFVEFGTGIIGAASPHPKLREGWKYDANAHGYAGWWYYDEKQARMRWTRGQPASAFVYKTVEYVKSQAPKALKVNLFKKV